MKTTHTKKVLLLGETINQHTLYGKFVTEEQTNDFADILVKEESVLRHEEPNGNFAEHKALKIEQGNWVMGRQVEYNPFSQSVTRVWD
jgi:hypothetical protein